MAKKKSIFKKWWFYVIAIPIILILFGAIRYNVEGKSPNGFCSTNAGCVSGLFCKEICFDAHGGSCLPFGSCKAEFCPLIGSSSAEQGKRYKCSDGSYGCVITQINTNQATCFQYGFEDLYFDCIGGKCLTHYDSRSRDEINANFDGAKCQFGDPDYIVNGECNYITIND